MRTHGAHIQWSRSTGPYGSRRRHRLLVAHDHAPLIDYESLGPDAHLAVPTPDHYLPLLYVIAGCRGDDEISFPVEGIDGGSVSMLAVRVG